MKILAKIVAVLFFLIGAFLIFAVIAAMSSDGGAKTGVAIGYVVAAIVLAFGGWKLWGVGKSSAGSAA